MKVSTEFPVTTGHRCDMTERLLKATLNPELHTHTRVTGNYITSCVTGNYTLNLDIDLQLHTSETCSMKEKHNNKD